MRKPNVVRVLVCSVTILYAIVLWEQAVNWIRPAIVRSDHPTSSESATLASRPRHSVVVGAEGNATTTPTSTTSGSAAPDTVVFDFNSSSPWFLARRRRWQEPEDLCFYTSRKPRHYPRWRPNCTVSNFRAVLWSVPTYATIYEWLKGTPRQVPAHLAEVYDAIKRYLQVWDPKADFGPPGYAPDNKYFFPPPAAFSFDPEHACKGKKISVAVATYANELAKDADLIIVDYPFIMRDGKHTMLPKLQPWQSAVLSFAGESAYYYPWAASPDFQSYFTMSIGRPRNKFDYPAVQPYAPTIAEMAASRRYNKSNPSSLVQTNSTVAMFVSNCEQALRRTYLEEFSRHLPVDSFGKCLRTATIPAEMFTKHGGKPDGNHFQGDYRAMKHELMSAYPFVLAFENRNCYDYVTEKVYDALLAGAVPIYMGSPNIADYVPPGSYIDVAWFSDPKELVAYIKHLLANPSEYDAYHRWRQDDPSKWTHLNNTLSGMTWCEALDNEYAATCGPRA